MCFNEGLEYYCKRLIQTIDENHVEVEAPNQSLVFVNIKIDKLFKRAINSLLVPVPHKY